MTLDPLSRLWEDMHVPGQCIFIVLCVLPRSASAVQSVEGAVVEMLVQRSTDLCARWWQFWMSCGACCSPRTS